MFKLLFCTVFVFSMIAKAGDVLTEKLVTQLLETKKAFVLSPYSIGASMSMTAEGAAGDTRKQFEKVLGLPFTDEIRKNTTDVFQTAQAVWFEQTYPVKSGYLDKLKKKYQAEFRKTDFLNKAEPARLEINKWVEEKTKDKIKDLLPAGSLNAQTRLVLVNGVYFKDSWMQAFDPALTTAKSFEITDKDSTLVEMLVKKFKAVKYYSSDKFESIQIPYKTKGFVLRVFLPKGFEITTGTVKEILSKKDKHYNNEEIMVQFPKFKIDFEIELSQTFKTLGLVLPFSDEANFSKLSPSANADRLKISLMQHKVFIEVNEEGTEAAAATGVVLEGRSARPKAKEFFANRPFIYEIVRINSATSEDSLFVGYYKPETTTKP